MGFCNPIPRLVLAPVIHRLAPLKRSGEPERHPQELRRFFRVLCQNREVIKQVDMHDVLTTSFDVYHLYRPVPMGSELAVTWPLIPRLERSEPLRDGRDFDGVL